MHYTTIDISNIINSLEGVAAVGNNRWRAKCPAHEDRNPSLFITHDPVTNKVLLKCFAGCTYQDIIKKVGDGSGIRHGNGNHSSKQKSGQKPTLVATYDYRDAGGTLLYQKLRYEPKAFRVRRPAGNKWEWSLGDTLPVLYRLPELVAASVDVPVYIVEGEKDVDRLAGLGLIATTNFDGAAAGNKTKWRDGYNQFLAGRDVIIIADNDDAGRNHANQIAISIFPVAQSVRIVNLPGVGIGGDVSDWLNNQHDELDDLQRLVDTTPYYQSQEDGADQEINVLKPATKDYLLAFKKLGYTFRLNMLDNTLEVNGQPMSDPVAALVRNRMRDLGLANSSRIMDACLETAWEKRYNPIVEYLSGLEWDGDDHILHLCSYLDETTGMGVVAIHRWLIGSVAKIFQNAQNFMLVIDGPQGVGKSHMARFLCPLPRYFVEGPINPDDKDSRIRLANKWIWEVSELQSTTRRADREALKSFISEQVVTVRPAYGKYDLVVPATASLIGTINEDGSGFLTDTTGNRRFVIICVEKIDRAYAHEVNIQQLWAQAVAMYRSGEPWQLQPAERMAQETINEEYQMQSIVEVVFWENYTIDFDYKQPTRLLDIIQQLENAGVKTSQRHIELQLNRLLKQAGCKRTRPRDDNGQRLTSFLFVKPIHVDPKL